MNGEALVFGHDIWVRQDPKSYQEMCIKKYTDKAVKEIMIEDQINIDMHLENPIDIRFILLGFLGIHIFDFCLYVLTEPKRQADGTYKGWDLWKLMDPRTRKSFILECFPNAKKSYQV